jgi:cell wall-associated NlpC family hydrolase
MDVKTTRSFRTGVILLTLVAAACEATRGARPQPFPRPGAQAPTGESTSEATPAFGAEIVEAALALQGTPYAPGGAGPDRFDCSGFVQFVFGRFDIALPRTVTQQFGATRAIRATAATAGDLVFFRIDGRKASHVGIAIGDGRFVHAPSARGVVRVETLSAPYWRDRFEGARRVPRDATRTGAVSRRQ